MSKSLSKYTFPGEFSAAVKKQKIIAKNFRLVSKHKEVNTTGLTNVDIDKQIEGPCGNLPTEELNGIIISDPINKKILVRQSGEWQEINTSSIGGGVFITPTGDTSGVKDHERLQTSLEQGSALLGPGDFFWNSPVIVQKNNSIIRGCGDASQVTLVSSANSSMIESPEDGKQRERLTVESLLLNGQGSLQTGESPAISLAGMNESRLKNLTIVNPKGHAINLEQKESHSTECTVPMVSGCILRGSQSVGNGINLGTYSSDSQIIGCDIGLFTKGAGILASDHSGFEWIGNQCWQSGRGYQVFGTSGEFGRGRIVGCLADFSKKQGFLLQNVWHMQLIGCQARESSEESHGTYDSFYVEGESEANRVEHLVINGCKANAKNAAYDLNLNKHIQKAKLIGNDFVSVHEGIDVGELNRWDTELSVTNAAGFQTVGINASGFLELNETSTTATAGATGVLPATVKGYIEIVIAGSTRKIPYYEP